MTPEIQSILDIVQQFGIWVIFAWLYVTEKRDHAETRRRAEQELKEARQAHMSDIRDIAGLQRSLYSVGTPMHPAVPRDLKEALQYPPTNHQPPAVP